MISPDNLTDGARLLVLQNAFIESNAKLDKHHKILLEGNGELPLVEKVRNLEAFATGLKFWFRTIAIAMVLQTITIMFGAVVYFIRLIPILEKLSKP